MLGLLLLGPSTYAQSVRYQSQAISSRGAGIANATIAVCTQPANTNTQPCSPLATLATSTSTTSGGANPLTADSFGNFFFYAAPGRYTVQIYGPAVFGQLVTPDIVLACDPTGTCTQSGAIAFTGAVTNCQLDGVLYVPGAAGCWAGADIGAQLNSAYAACPAANSVCHIMLTNSAPLNFSTTINFNVSGKYVLLESLYPCVFVTTAAGGCLNFTPTSGIALELDYVPTTASGFSTAHGLKNVGIINNSCFTSGGCGGTAFAIDIGNTNHGASNATFDTVSIIGFNFGFNISNTQNLPSVTWFNPHFQDNNIAFIAGNETGNTIVGGLFIANQSNIQATSAVGGEFTLIGTGMSTNTSGPMFDFTRNSTRALFNCIGCHFEDSATSNANSPHYIQGLVEARIYGGTMETDQTTGTQDWFVNISAGGALEVHGLDLASGGKTFTQAFLLNTTARANIQVTLFTPSLFPTIAGGAGASSSLIAAIAGNTATYVQNTSNTVALTADWTCGTGGTVASCTSATIIGSGGGVPLTFSLPALTASYTMVCDGVVGQATAATANQWNLLTATNGATNVTANYSMATAATASAYGAVTDQASTTTTFQIAPSWTLGGTATKMPFHIWAKIEGASTTAGGTVVSLQLLAPTVGDLVTIYRGTACRLF